MALVPFNPIRINHDISITHSLFHKLPIPLEYIVIEKVVIGTTHTVQQPEQLVIAMIASSCSYFQQNLNRRSYLYIIFKKRFIVVSNHRTGVIPG